MCSFARQPVVAPTSSHASAKIRICKRAHSADSAGTLGSHVKHSVSADSSAHVEPCFIGLFAQRRDIAVGSARRESARGCTQTLEIKPFSQSNLTRKCLRSVTGVLFFAPILIGACV